MSDELRKPFLILALALMVLVVLVELGSVKIIGLGSAGSAVASALDAPTPGFGIPYLALFDGLLLYSVALIAVSLLVPEAIHGRVQGIVTLVVSLLWMVMAFLMAVAAVVLLMLMVTLLVSPIFGTIAYFAIFGGFDRSGAHIALALLTALKIGFAVCLVIAHPRFLQNKGLVAMVAVALLLNLLLAFLHALVPWFLVSITDMVGAIVFAVIALLRALVSVVESVMSIFRAVV